MLIKYLITMAVVLAAAMAQAVTGFGFNVVSAPLLVQIYSPTEGVFLTLLVSSVTSAWIAIRTGAWKLPSSIRGPVVTAVVGLPFGFVLQQRLSAGHLRLFVSTIAAVFICFFLISFRPAVMSSHSVGLVVGFLSGVLATSSSLAGPPMAVYLLSRGWSKSDFKLMMTAFVFWIGSAAAAMQALWGAHPERLWWVTLAALPFVLLGNWLGEQSLAKIGPAIFQRLVLALVIGSVIQGLLSLWVR